jgi:hypothetical protein
MLAEVELRYLDIAYCCFFFFDFKEIESVGQLRAMASFLGKNWIIPIYHISPGVIF